MTAKRIRASIKASEREGRQLPSKLLVSLTDEELLNVLEKELKFYMDASITRKLRSDELKSFESLLRMRNLLLNKPTVIQSSVTELDVLLEKEIESLSEEELMDLVRYETGNDQ